VSGEAVVRPWRRGDESGILSLILPIQQDEFAIPITAAEQPDLADIEGYYLPGAGGFWVGETAGRIVGTIALKDIGAGRGALRKMFVAAAHRGAPSHLGERLLRTLLGHARGAGLREILLGTTDFFVAAHRFYEKHGFRAVEPAELPPSFPRMAVDTRFYALSLA
jgi:N-acetylglutamate synthase-like GNAT family acetyltransferase